MYIFPFDIVNKNEKILIYGVGNVGKDYYAQVSASQFCSVEGFIDKNIDYRSFDGKRIYTIKEIEGLDFDRIIVAVKNDKERHEIEKVLCDNNIEMNKIVSSTVKTGGNNPIVVECKPVDDEIVHIGLYNPGGLGDSVLDLVLAQKLRILYGNRIHLFNATKYSSFFEGNPLYDECRDIDELNDADIIILNRHVATVLCWSPEKVKRIEPDLVDFCKKNIEFCNNKTTPERFERDVYTYAKVTKKNRIEIIDVENVLSIDRRDNVLINWKSETYEVLKRFGLLRKKYILINRDVDAVQGMNNVKLWPREHYIELIRLIRKEYSTIKIIEVGARNGEKSLEGTDGCIKGKTSFDELKILLKNSILLISSEGGLVHINHFLSKRSAVLFGPSDEEYFGYADDFICVNRKCCGMPCNYMDKDYRINCMRKYDHAECMYLIKPEQVYSRIKEYINSKINSLIEYDIIPKEEAINTYYTYINRGQRVFRTDEYSTSCFSPFSFLPNYPSFEACFDCILIERKESEYSDPYGVFLEMLRLLSPSGVLIMDPFFVAKDDTFGINIDKDKRILVRYCK